jgi:hypothetical protein
VSETVLDRVVGCLRAALDAFDPNVRVAPVALLWTDEGAQWAPILPRIAERLPVASLGAYEPEARRGPAYWLRCVVARRIDAGLPDGPVVVYLPGVSRSELRAADTCPPKLAPIAELQYRSQWFSHPNNRDWTVRALLTNRERGLGLHIVDDPDTNNALLLAFDRLLDEPVDRLAKQVIDEDFLLELVNEDVVGALLRWLDDPQSFHTHADTTRWTAFVQQCKSDFAFDPGTDGEITAARKLGARQGQWANAWRRFAETPNRYPGIADQLRRARPDELIVDNVDAWPQDNEQAEDQLRSRLRDFAVLTPEGARKEITALEKDHGWRRGTVWADLDQAPLAFGLEHLGTLAEVTAQPLDDVALAALMDDHLGRGWRADDAVVQALASVHSAADRGAVSAACAALYRQWLDDGARALQKAVGPMANAYTYTPGPRASTTPGAITVFVDGLRLDVARRLEEQLAGTGLDVATTTSLAALPTVTETAKAALVPAQRASLGPGPDLYPSNAVTGTKASIQVLRGLMAENGVQVLGATDTGDPSGTAWTETGEIDHRGHDIGARVVEFLDEEVHRLAGRIRELLDVGWGQVDVVTDHGWVLLPGGMEKVELPAATTELKKGRCARLKDGAAVDFPTVPWFWDPDVRIALAPGATCFEANKEYEHGGVSPQECIVPRLTVRAGAQAPGVSAPEFTKVKWLGLQCRVEFSGVAEKVTVDLRGLPAEPTSSIAEQTKQTSTAGKVSLFVRDEEHEGERAHLVLVSPSGKILAQREVVVGRNR